MSRCQKDNTTGGLIVYLNCMFSQSGGHRGELVSMHFNIIFADVIPKNNPAKFSLKDIFLGDNTYGRILKVRNLVQCSTYILGGN
jgi:hypothetical protein